MKRFTSIQVNPDHWVISNFSEKGKVNERKAYRSFCKRHNVPTLDWQTKKWEKEK